MLVSRNFGNDWYFLAELCRLSFSVLSFVSSTLQVFSYFPRAQLGDHNKKIQLHYFVIFVRRISRFPLRMQPCVRLLSLVGVHFKMLPENQELIMSRTVWLLTLVVKGEGVLDHGNATASVIPQSMGVCVDTIFAHRHGSKTIGR
jgi:hypothetical protein